ncbi:hypothetical protein GCM10028806_33200 [Spirosoma terrae]|uniref:Uncharacterized protein n=1 Tax=Spirosoma terrae TaxID=1968276 RepID=A0A6L9L570_9BACT|nr:hypothetical protein [Spirosoma terrae]NDU95634.1 hypothetical protein [Spirosoma terrae]
MIKDGAHIPSIPAKPVRDLTKDKISRLVEEMFTLPFSGRQNGFMFMENPQKTYLPPTTLEELQQTEWYRTRPSIIQEAIDYLPPLYVYRFKNSGKQCVIVSYGEPEEEGGPVTVTVQKTGEGGSMAELGLGILDQHQVFGVSLDDLERVESK